MLEDIKYVRCLLIDFSKAFDYADHLVLINNLKEYNIADIIIVPNLCCSRSRIPCSFVLKDKIKIIKIMKQNQRLKMS